MPRILLLSHCRRESPLLRICSQTFVMADVSWSCWRDWRGTSRWERVQTHMKRRTKRMQLCWLWGVYKVLHPVFIMIFQMPQCVCSSKAVRLFTLSLFSFISAEMIHFHWTVTTLLLAILPNSTQGEQTFQAKHTRLAYLFNTICRDSHLIGTRSILYRPPTNTWG